MCGLLAVVLFFLLSLTDMSLPILNVFMLIQERDRCYRLQTTASSLTSFRSGAVDLIFRHLIFVVVDMVADFIVYSVSV